MGTTLASLLCGTGTGYIGRDVRRYVRKKIAKFIESLDLGVSAADFTKAMDSFAVNTAIKRAMLRAQQAGIQAVPSVVINGKYLTGNTLA